MNLKTLFLASIALILVLPDGWSQITAVYTEANRHFRQGEAHFDDGLYGKSMTAYQKVINLRQPVNEPEFERLLVRSELQYAKAAVREDRPEGQRLIEDFIKKYSPDPIANQALVEMANYYFNDKNYEEAVKFYAKIPTYQLPQNERAEVLFRMGYSYFVRKQFPEAKSAFNQVRSQAGEHYEDANYYYGLCEFFAGNYDQSVAALKIAERDRRYGARIPYYITQMYFAQGQFEEVINYAVPKLNESRVRNTDEMSQLVGQAYIEKQQYKEALPFLEAYAEGTSRLTEEELFQLGFIQYENGKYRSAINNLQELASTESELGQLAMYYLGDAHIKNNDRTSARSAFASASRMSYDPEIQIESLFQFGKLSYELKYDSDALNALRAIPKSSIHHDEAQSLTAQLLSNTADYSNALAEIEKMGGATNPQLKEAYQKLNYKRGLQLYRDGRSAESTGYFTQAVGTPVDLRTKALATFWLGNIEHDKGNYTASSSYLSSFLTMAQSLSGLPDEASVFMANYIQGYNYLKRDQHNDALTYFRDVVSGVARNASLIKDRTLTTDVLNDATLRAGDCYFRRNIYDKAMEYYDQVIQRKGEGTTYALYQKATILGLQNEWSSQSNLLDQIVEQYPNSSYADNALYDQGALYQEKLSALKPARTTLLRLVNEYRGKSNLINAALLRLGLISFNLGVEEESLDFYKQVLNNNPTPDEQRTALQALEQILVRNNSDSQAYLDILASTSTSGGDVDEFVRDSITYRAALSLYDKGEGRAASERFGDYIKNFPKGAYIIPAYFNRAELHNQFKDYANSVRDFEAVINMGPSEKYKDALFRAAEVAYNGTEDFASALRFYKLLEPLVVGSEELFDVQLGALRSAFRANDTRQVQLYADGVRRSPKATSNQKLAANYYLGESAFQNKDYQTALSAFQQGLSSGASNGEMMAEVRYKIARTYYEMRDINTAYDQANLAAKANSGYNHYVGLSLILMSDIEAERGLLSSAKLLLEVVLKSVQDDPELLAIANQKMETINRRLGTESRVAPSSDGNMLMDEGE